VSKKKVASQYEEAARLLGLKVKAARVALGLTQAELAEKIGKSRNQVQNIERNRNNSRDPVTGEFGSGNPQLDTVYILAEVLGVKATYLVDASQPVIAHKRRRRPGRD
jgi:transcriptional regulator with XRE-family HTH domain